MNLFVELAKVINPAVGQRVHHLSAARTGCAGGDPNRDPFFDLFEQFSGGSPFGTPAPQQSLGTGFIIRDDGLIVTNNHVIDHADIIKVEITEGTKENFDAKLIGKDANTDIALIKIDSKA